MFDRVFVKTKEDDKIGLSADDRKFLAITNSYFEKESNGNLTATLPFKKQRPALPNNKALAFKQAHFLDTNLKRNPIKQKHMDTYVLEQGAAEVAQYISPDQEC